MSVLDGRCLNRFQEKPGQCTRAAKPQRGSGACRPQAQICFQPQDLPAFLGAASQPLASVLGVEAHGSIPPVWSTCVSFGGTADLGLRGTPKGKLVEPTLTTCRGPGRGIVDDLHLDILLPGIKSCARNYQNAWAESCVDAARAVRSPCTEPEVSVSCGAEWIPDHQK